MVNKKLVNKGKVKTTMNEELEKLRKKERIFKLTLDFKKLYPIQRITRPQTISLGYVYKASKKTTTKQRVDESNRPDIEAKSQKLVEKTECANVFTFERDKEGNILINDLFGRWGSIHKAFHEIWKSMRKANYKVEMINLFKVIPSNGGKTLKLKSREEFGDNAPDKPFSLPVPRSGGRTRQMEYYDYIEDRKGIEVIVKFPNALPMSKDEMMGLVHGLEFINLHPLRRGEVKIAGIEVVQSGYR